MYLEEFGPLEEVNIFHDRGFDHRFRRYAFAKFSYRDDAIKAYVVRQIPWLTGGMC